MNVICKALEAPFKMHTENTQLFRIFSKHLQSIQCCRSYIFLRRPFSAKLLKITHASSGVCVCVFACMYV